MTPLKHTNHVPRVLTSGHLRRLAVVGVIAPLIAVSGCTGTTPTPTSTTAGAFGSSTSGPATPDATGTSAATSTTTAPTPEPSQTDLTLDLKLKDPQLGHAATVTMIARNIPWPADAPVGEAAFEIVGVYLTVVAGKQFSATVEPTMFTLQAGPAAAAPPTTEFGKQFGTPLAVAKRGETTKGWLFFKVPRDSAAPFTLYLNRPAYTVSTTGKSFPATKVGVKVAG